MNSDTFWKLILGLALAFALPCLSLVVGPFVRMSNAEPVAYGEESDVAGQLSAYPQRGQQRKGESDYGRQVYAAEGCAYCHTQVIRPTYAGPDLWRPGWGGREGEELARHTRARDYVNEEVAPLGYQRIGQDLANVGHRITTREAMHRHLRAPKSFNPDSGMPAYRHLYRESPYGKGFIPTSRAEALVDYLLSLKKDQPLPADLGSGQ